MTVRVLPRLLLRVGIAGWFAIGVFLSIICLRALVYSWRIVYEHKPENTFLLL